MCLDQITSTARSRKHDRNRDLNCAALSSPTRVPPSLHTSAVQTRLSSVYEACGFSHNEPCGVWTVRRDPNMFSAPCSSSRELHKGATLSLRSEQLSSNTSSTRTTALCKGQTLAYSRAMQFVQTGYRPQTNPALSNCWGHSQSSVFSWFLSPIFDDLEDYWV